MNFSVIVYAAPYSVDMSVKAGYDDVMRVGASARFHITLVNKGDGFSGEAQVVIDTGYRTKAIYAMPFELPQGSTKELALDVPVRTANRKVQVIIESKGKKIKVLDYSFKKLISPENPTIGALSDASNQLMALNGLIIAENLNNTDPREVKMQETFSKRPAELFRLDKESLPDNVEVLNALDYIVIADFDTSVLSKKQLEALEKWVDGGKTLVLAGGTNGRKVYSGLGEALKPFQLLENKKESLVEELEKLTGKKAPDALVDISTGKVGEGKILMGDEVTPLVVTYKKADGVILFFAFDPTLSPVSVWENTGDMWKELLDSSSHNDYNQVANIYGRRYSDFDSIARQVPEEQTPPYNALMIIIAIYILIVGPLIYLYLKWRDKRDLNWVIVPVLAFLCMGIIYGAGFRTRYTTAVLNNFSIINLNSTNKKAEIQTTAAAFNNKWGIMTLEYKDDYEIEVNREDDYRYGYSYNGYSEEDYKNAVVKSKVYAGEPIKHEMYNVGIWEPCVMAAKQTQEYDGNLISDIDINSKEFSAVIKNDTGFAFEDSFVAVGGKFIDVGDMLPGEEKKIRIPMDDKSIFLSYDQLLNSRYIRWYDMDNAALPKDWKEQVRKRNALENIFDKVATLNGSFDLYNRGVTFIALNFDKIDYGIKVNGKEAKSFNTNVVYSAHEITFQKGKKVEIPEGFINAVFESGDGIGFEGAYGESIVAYNDTEAFFKFDVPQGMLVDKFKIDWSASIPEYMKEKYAQSGEVQGVDGSSYKLFVFNNKTKDWESVEDVFEPQGDLSAYINEINEIKLKVNINIDESMGRSEYMWKPEISLSGVIR